MNSFTSLMISLSALDWSSSSPSFGWWLDYCVGAGDGSSDGSSDGWYYRRCLSDVCGVRDSLLIFRREDGAILIFSQRLYLCGGGMFECGLMVDWWAAGDSESISGAVKAIDELSMDELGWVGVESFDSESWLGWDWDRWRKSWWIKPIWCSSWELASMCFM